MTNAERQKKFREARKAEGMKKVAIEVTEADLDELKRLWVISGDGKPFIVWLSKCAMTGAKFRANSGGVLAAGSKAKGEKKLRMLQAAQ